MSPIGRSGDSVSLFWTPHLKVCCVEAALRLSLLPVLSVAFVFLAARSDVAILMWLRRKCYSCDVVRFRQTLDMLMLRSVFCRLVGQWGNPIVGCCQ